VNRAFSPRIVGTIRPDFHSLDTVLKSPPFACKSGEDLVLAIYDYFTSRADGTYHFWPADERAGHPRIRRNCIDPIKLLNAYGWMICGQAAHFLYALYRQAGLQARIFGVPGHCLCEVFYDERWHVLDVDMWTWFRTPAGHIASAYELAKDAQALILENPNKSNPCNLPDRSLEDYAAMYAKCETVDDRVKDIRPDWLIRAHNMDFRLRPGETLIRSQQNQGRFHMPREWKKFMERFPHEWHGHPRERFEPFRTFGNGRWIYEPNLAAGFRDFAEGVWQREGLKQDDAGLVGPGSATFRIQSPYPFCGIPNWQGEEITASDGVWLDVAGTGPIEVCLTDPEGNWAAVFGSSGSFDERIDITGWLDSRYECFIRFTLGEGATLRRFRFDGFVMTAPLAIPRLVEGENRMELRCGDKYGLCTVPWPQCVDFRRKADLAKQWFSAENGVAEPQGDDWQVIRPIREDQPVQVTFRFDAPAGRRFAWCYAVAAVREGPPNEPPRSVKLEWSADGRDYKPLVESPISNTERQWDCTADGEVLLPGPAESFWLRITSQTPICGVEFCGHLLCESASQAAPLEITHRWQEDAGEREFKAPAGATTYTISCGRDPRGHTIEMRMPSIRQEP